MNLSDKILLEYILFHKVKSSNLSHIGYDEQKKLLQIKFLSGGHYEYYDVPKSLFRQFMRAQSKGKFAWRRLYPNYEYKRLTYLKKKK